MSSSRDLGMLPLIPLIIGKVRAYEKQRGCRYPIPIITNGDLYHPAEIARHIRSSGCTSIMLSRCVLLNASVIKVMRKWYDECPRGTDGSSSDQPPDVTSLDMTLIQPPHAVIRDYLRKCLEFPALPNIIKYTLQEMCLYKRHPHSILVSEGALLITVRLHRFYIRV